MSLVDHDVRADDVPVLEVFPGVPLLFAPLVQDLLGNRLEATGNLIPGHGAVDALLALVPLGDLVGEEREVADEPARFERQELRTGEDHTRERFAGAGDHRDGQTEQDAT